MQKSIPYSIILGMEEISVSKLNWSDDLWCIYIINCDSVKENYICNIYIYVCVR